MPTKTLLSLMIALTIGACSSKPPADTTSISCNAPSDLTSLSGTYEAANIGINKKGKHIGTTTLSINVDADGVITGERTWSSKTHQGFKLDGTPATSDTEDVIGVIDSQDCEIGLADVGEIGSYRGRLLPDGSIDLILIQSGDEPLAIRNRYQLTSNGRG